MQLESALFEAANYYCYCYYWLSIEAAALLGLMALVPHVLPEGARKCKFMHFVAVCKLKGTGTDVQSAVLLQLLLFLLHTQILQKKLKNKRVLVLYYLL